MMNPVNLSAVRGLDEMARLFLAASVTLAAFAASAVDWQFTGATNRTAVAARTCVISSEFDSQIPSTVLLSGCNMRSDAVGTLILFR